MHLKIFFQKRKLPHKVLRGMFIVLASFLIHPDGFAQNIALDMREASLEKVFKEIERKTRYRFIYTKEEVSMSKPVSIQVSGSTIQQVLERVLTDQSLGYTIHKNYITIFREVKGSEVSKSEDRFDVAGSVQDFEGKGLSGVSIIVEGSSRMVVSDQDGHFEVKLVKESDHLLVSRVGYEMKRVGVRRDILIVLEQVIPVLNEAIVRGYYNTTKRENTGAVVKVSGEELMKQPVSNPLAGLAGRAPGLFIKQSNGLPGSNFTLLIRGQNSLRSGTEPLYIIDGVPFDVRNMNQRGAALNTNNPFNTLSPSDIESIEILKDADAIAIYGSRGSNGVVLITTKRAKQGEPSVDVNLYYGIGKITRGMEYMNTQQYIEMRREAFKNDGVTMTVANASDLLVWDTTRYTDWQKLLISGTAKYTNAQVRYNGGNELTRFSINSNYNQETTVFPGDFRNERITTSVIINHRDKAGKFSSIIRSSYADGKNNMLTNDLSAVVNLPPNAPAIYDSTGALNWNEGGVNWQNPFAELLKEYKGRSRRWSSSLDIGYKFLKELEVKLNTGFNSFLFEETQVTPIQSQNPVNNPKGSASFGNSDHIGWTMEPQMRWIKSYNNHHIDLLVGLSLVENRTKKIMVNGSGYSDDGMLYSLVGANEVNSTNDLVEYKYMAGFGRIGYDYKRKLMLNLTGRRDGSSRFGTGRQFASFGAVGAGWIFTEEDWFKKISWIRYGKLRGSYGTAGNDQIGDYQFMDTWTSTSNNYGGELSLRPSRLLNTDYSWEQNQKMNIGLELGLINNKIFVQIDWYRNLSKNQLITQSIPSQTGFVSIVENFPGEVVNKGWEIDLETEIIKNESFQWKSSFNITAGTNILKKFPELENTNFANNYRVGKPVNGRIGYGFTGLNIQTGVYMFEDLNGDSLLNSQDYRYLGTTDPKYYGGWQNSFQYKSYTIDFLFQFTNQSGRHPIYGSSITGIRLNAPVMVLDRWQKPGEYAAFQKFTQQTGTDAAKANSFMGLSDGSFTDASYIRLKNLSVRYSFGRIMRTSKIKADIYLQGQNLITITNFPGGDPENNTGLAPLKVITAGIQINL